MAYGDRYFAARYFPNRYFPPGIPTGPGNDVFLSFSSIGKTLLVNPELRVTYELSLISDGYSVTSSTLSYLQSLAIQATGSSLLGVNARIDAALKTTASGISAVSFNTRPERGLALSSAGVSSTDVALRLLSSMQAALSGTSSVTTSLHLIAALSAASSGNSFVVFELNGESALLRLGPALIDQVLIPAAGVSDMNPTAAFSQVLGPDATLIAQTIQAVSDQSTYTATISPLGISAVVFTRPELFARITVVSESEIEQRGIGANVLPSYPSSVTQRENPKADIS